MTRQQIRAQALSESGHLDVPGYDDPFTLDNWVDRAVTEICQITQHAYLTFSCALTSGQAVYCLPALFYVESVVIKRPAGSDPLLKELTLWTARQQNDARFTWRTDPADPGEPQQAVIEGGQDYRLYPTPNYTQATAGITVRGFGVLTRDAWANDEDECPLPERVHDAVMNYVAMRLCRRARDAQGEANFDRAYRRGKGFFEGEMQTLTEMHRHRFPGYEGGDYYYPSGPLNL